jgi:hypothetical protein
MLELRVVVGARKIASMRDAIARECRRVDAADDHVERVCTVAVELITDDVSARGLARRENSVLVVVTVHSDSTMLLVRDPAATRGRLGDRRYAVLQESTARWSTMSGSEGRTIWAEIPRVAVAPVACAR